MSLKGRQDLYSIVDHDQDVGYLAITCKEVTGNFKQCSGMFFFLLIYFVIQIQLVYNLMFVVLVSGVYYSDSTLVYLTM